MTRAERPPRRTRGLLGGRSAEVVRRVLDAAVVELAQVGYAGLRVDRVADRAAVNKTTVYRRWATREALVAAVVERLREPLREHTLPDTGRLAADLVMALERRAAVGRTVEGRAWARLLEARALPAVEAIVGAAVEERRAEWLAMVARAIQRREVPPDTDAQLLLDVVRAIVDGRNTARSARSRWLTVAVETVLAGARAGTLARAAAGSAARAATGSAAKPTAAPRRATAQRR